VTGTRPTSDLDRLAKLLGLSPADLKTFEPRYRQVKIPKKSGGNRILLIPDDPTKILQRRLTNKLLSRYKTHDKCFGFAKGSSTVQNALPHIAKDTVIKLDIKDFFPNTNAFRIVDMFSRTGWTNDAARMLTKLVCVKNGLPQGAPSSPMMSNIVNWHMDKRFDCLAQSIGMEYSRYADDLTFSYNHYSRKEIHHLLTVVGKILKDCQYSMNRKKKRILRSHRRQTVTGIVVNKQLNLPRKTRRWLRSVKHRLNTNAANSTLSQNEYNGWIGYLKMVNPNDSLLHNAESQEQGLQLETGDDFNIAGTTIPSDYITAELQEQAHQPESGDDANTAGTTTPSDHTTGKPQKGSDKQSVGGIFHPIELIPFKLKKGGKNTTLKTLGIVPLTNAMTPSQYFSAHLFSTTHKSATKIATARSLKEKTVWRHLAIAIEQGIIQPRELVRKKVYANITKYLDTITLEHQPRLRGIYSHFKETISFEEIQLALALRKRTKIWSAVQHGNNNLAKLSELLSSDGNLIHSIKNKKVTFSCTIVHSAASFSFDLPESHVGGRELSATLNHGNPISLELFTSQENNANIDTLVKNQKVLVRGRILNYESDDRLISLLVNDINLYT
jgi:RNA-directed DNA polymerase